MLTFIGVSVGVVFTLVSGLIGVLFARISHLEDRITKAEKATDCAEKYNRRMWEWARRHVDLYYTYRRAGSPDPDPIPSEDDDD